MAQSLNLVFCGTPRFAVPTLERLVDTGFMLRLVVTQPDRPKGRGLELVPSPVKQSALQLGLPIVQPDTIKNNTDFRAQLSELRPDAIIVVGYGRIIPQWMLDLPPLGNINLHASLLPKYRGAAPIQWAIARGETATGVTTMKIDAGLDTGDILLQQEIPIESDDIAETLAPKLAAVGAKLIVTTLQGLGAGTIDARKQDNSQATLAPILKKEDGRIDFSRPAAEILNRLRGFRPWPGAYSLFRGKKLQVWKASAINRAVPSSDLKAEGNHLFVGCGEGTSIEILELQLEGKKRASAADFIRGYRPVPGEKLGL
ncbi:MAG TPA: methionyl-tRNA formyltransferase [Candidatus Sulfotelmatobacter sp.]|jgi:methionyl-tRNA formyltransferase|nr:methionyl-tRNA formyltransferase [Candidatus Sulfotelmatobacter sp.]